MLGGVFDKLKRVFQKASVAEVEQKEDALYVKPSIVLDFDLEKDEDFFRAVEPFINSLCDLEGMTGSDFKLTRIGVRDDGSEVNRILEIETNIKTSYSGQEGFIKINIPDDLEQIFVFDTSLYDRAVHRNPLKYAININKEDRRQNAMWKWFEDHEHQYFNKRMPPPSCDLSELDGFGVALEYIRVEAEEVGLIPKQEGNEVDFRAFHETQAEDWCHHYKDKIAEFLM